MQTLCRNMKIVCIGAGNLSTHLSQALQNAGFEILQVYSRTETSAKTLAGLLQTSYTTDIDCIADDASLYIVSVSDDAIKPLSESLPLTGKLVVHTAGSVPMDIFAGRFENYGVLYPLQTFSKQHHVDFSDIPMFIEANSSDNLHVLRMVAGAVSQKVYQASSSERMQLHLAAVFGCNFVNYLYHISNQIVQKSGFDFSVLSQLILETVRKAIVSGNPECIQTGPAVRGDRAVMRKHMDLLADQPDLQAIYALLSENIGKMKTEG